MSDSLANFQICSNTKPTRVLALVDYYLPGYKAGGPIRTVSNMVEQLGEDIRFMIVTRDRDLNDGVPYSDIRVNDWNKVGAASVFYASPSRLSLRGIVSLIQETPHDVLYLNSFFSPRTTGIVLAARLLKLCIATPTVLAPRGEFSHGALALKALKKNLYIRVSGVLGMYRELTWQASSSHESEDIQRVMGATAHRIIVAPNLLSSTYPLNHVGLSEDGARQPGSLRLIFLSRISRKKNLGYLLRRLRLVKTTVELNIFGPIEDLAYWKECQHLIATLPQNILVKYRGTVRPAEVSTVFKAHDVFVFPTLGENFGHVIFEALCAGTAVIVSDQTPWQADAAGACQIIPLAQQQDYVAAIHKWAAFTDVELANYRKAALTYAQQKATNKKILEDNLNLFRNTMEGSNTSEDRKKSHVDG